MSINVTTMTKEQLESAVAEYKDAAEKCRLAQSELSRRSAQAEEEAEEKERKDFFASDKFKKIQAKFKKAMERVNTIAKGGKRELTVNLPITFTYTLDTYDMSSDDCCEKDLSDVFSREGVKGKIGNIEGVNKKQKALLQVGMDQVIANACEEIYGLFPDVEKEMESATNELNKVMEEAGEHDLSLEDLGYKP